MVAIFPKSLFSWVNRIDHQDIDYANDINSVANELIAVENTLGIQPQVEANPPTGGPVTYSSVNARITDTLVGTNRPVVELVGYNQPVPSGSSVNNAFTVKYDPFNMFNGTDLTIPAQGWWHITAHNVWRDPFVGAGFSLLLLLLNNDVVDTNYWNWEFPNHTLWPLPRGSSSAGVNHVYFQGLLNKGDRVSVLTTNGTYENPHVIKSGNLKASFIRTVTGNFHTDT